MHFLQILAGFQAPALVSTVFTEALLKVNQDLITPYRIRHFAPSSVIDGDLVPDAPAYLLAKTAYDQAQTVPSFQNLRRLVMDFAVSRNLKGAVGGVSAR